MLARIRNRLTYANLMATMAVFIALGGTSYAALKLPRNSVGTKQLKKNAVTSTKVKPGSLLASDLKASARGSLRGQRGAQGARGPSGPAGPPGPTTVYRDDFAYAVPGTIVPGIGFVDLHTLNLPPGSYVVSATVTVSNDGAANDGAVCDIIGGAAAGSVRFAATTVPATLTVAAESIAFNSTTAQTIRLQCGGNLSGGTVRRRVSSLTAVKVGQVVP